MRFDNFIVESRDEDPFEVLEELYAVAFPYIKEYLGSVRITYNSKMLYSGRKGNDVRALKNIRKDRKPKDTPYEVHSEFDQMFYDNFGVRYRSHSVFCTGSYSQASGYGDSVYAIFPMGSDYSYCWSSYINDLFTYVVDSGDYDFRYFTWDVEDVVEDLIGEGSGDDEYEDITYRLGEEFDENHDVSDYYDYDNFPDLDEDDEDYDESADDDREDDAQNQYDDDRQTYIDDNADEALRDYLFAHADGLVTQCYENVETEITRYTDDNLQGALESKSEIMLSGSKYMMVRVDYIPYILRYMEKYGSKKPTKELFMKSMVGFDIKRYTHSRVKRDVERHFKKYVNKDLMDMMDELKP